MPTSDPMTILLKHDRWATQTLFDACESLDDEALDREFEMGVGSLRNSIIHIMSALRGWSDLLAGREQRPGLEKEEFDRSMVGLKALFEEIIEDFHQLATSHPADELVTGSRGGRSFTFARGAVVTHVTTHGMHHRAQCLNMLRQIGVDKLPQSAVVEWILYVDSSSDS